jgi:hypothetical protein
MFKQASKQGFDRFLFIRHGIFWGGCSPQPIGIGRREQSNVNRVCFEGRTAISIPEIQSQMNDALNLQTERS